MALCLLLTGGCLDPSRAASYPQSLRADDAAVCIPAFRVAADRSDRDALPALVDRLEDEDEAVRMFASMAMERITGTTLGYVYYAAPADRARAVSRWRSYLRSTTTAATQPGGATDGPTGTGGAR